MWSRNGERILWQIDSEWSNRDKDHTFRFYEDAKRILSLYALEDEFPLPKEDYAWLSEGGYLEFKGDYNGMNSLQSASESRKSIGLNLMR